MALLEELGTKADIDLVRARQRAESLANCGFGVADAAHVAFAEECGAKFITCDDRLIKKCLIITELGEACEHARKPELKLKLGLGLELKPESRREHPSVTASEFKFKSKFKFKAPLNPL